MVTASGWPRPSRPARRSTPICRAATASLPAAPPRRNPERALQDALRADVDPAAGGHLAVHDQPLGLPAVEVLLCGPVGTMLGVGDEHARASAWCGRRPRLTALHQQRLVVFQFAQTAQDGVEGVPVAERPAAAAIDDEVLRIARPRPGRGCSGSCGGGLLQPAFCSAGLCRGARMVWVMAI